MEDSHTPFRLSDLKIDGNDLIQLGFKSKEIKEALERLFRECVIEPGKNERERLLKNAEGILKNE